MARRLLSCVVAAAVMAVAVNAWGPITHYYYTCAASDIPLDKCFDHMDLLSGTEMPDAFGFGSFLEPMSGPLPGQGWEYLDLHSPLLAGYLYKNAANYTTATFNATEFAIGFGMHVTADAAGFFDHGYLGYGWGKRYTPLLNGTANWLNLWPFMSAVDAHVYKEFFERTKRHVPRSGVPSTSNETARFVSETVQMAIANGSVFPTITAPTVSTVAAMWQSLLTDEAIKAEVTPPEVFTWQMVYNDRYDAKNFTEAAKHYDMVRGCAVQAARTWHEAIRQPSVTPMAAVEATIQYVEAAYAKGVCVPTPPPKGLVELEW
jgi:hypothetical protein